MAGSTSPATRSRGKALERRVADGLDTDADTEAGSCQRDRLLVAETRADEQRDPRGGGLVKGVGSAVGQHDIDQPVAKQQRLGHEWHREDTAGQRATQRGLVNAEVGR